MVRLTPQHVSHDVLFGNPGSTSLVNLPNEPQGVEIKLPILIPFELFNAAYKQGPMLFNHCTAGDAAEVGIRDFWKEAMTEDWAKQHPFTGNHQIEHMS